MTPSRPASTAIAHCPTASRRRSAARCSAAAVPRPRVLDLGAGTGRIGWPFVAAGDDYVGVDLSLGMLRAFVARVRARAAAGAGRRPAASVRRRDVRAVMLIQVFGGLSDWRQFADEARRVLRPDGAVVIGRTAAPRGRRRRADEAAARSSHPGRGRSEATERAGRGRGPARRACDRRRAPHRRRRGRRNARRASSSRAIATVRASPPCPRAVKDDAMARLADLGGERIRLARCGVIRAACIRAADFQV